MVILPLAPQGEHSRKAVHTLPFTPTLPYEEQPETALPHHTC